jgi:hypothetical protein
MAQFLLSLPKSKKDQKSITELNIPINSNLLHVSGVPEENIFHQSREQPYLL